MICGTWKKNLLVGVVTLLTSLFFCCCCSSSSAFAESLTFKESRQNYTPNWTSPQGQWSWSQARAGLYSIQNVINANGFLNTNRTTPYDYPEGFRKISFETNNVTFTNNAGTLHAEYNLVFTSKDAVPATPAKYALNLVNQGPFEVSYCNRSVRASNVTYVTTDWTYNYVVNPDIAYYRNTTLTLYIDIVFQQLDVGSSGPIYCEIQLEKNNTDPGFSFFNTETSRTYVWSEKFENEITFFANLDNALQVQQANILNQQYQLQQWQYEEQQRQFQLQQDQWNQEQNDRDNISDRADDATSAGNNATSNAQSATNSLLSAITGIYGTLLHPSITNCQIGPINLYGQLNLGTLDFCRDMITPDPLFAIGGLLMIGLIIMLAWSVLNSGMSLYKDLFGGKS